MSGRLRRLGLQLLLPLWNRAPGGLRHWLIWQGASKFLVGVAAICLNPDGQMLLLHHRFHNEHPWGFPGGWLDRGETPEEGVLREVREETGLSAQIEELLTVLGDGVWVEVYYLCRVPDVTPRIQQSEASGYRWVDPLACDLPLTSNQARVLGQARDRLRDAR